MPNLDLPCESPATQRVRAEGSYLYPGGGPGLGVELDEERLRELTVATA